MALSTGLCADQTLVPRNPGQAYAMYVGAGGRQALTTARQEDCLRNNAIIRFTAAAALAWGCVPAWAQDAHAPRYDYPTAARADYVIGCLAANGFQRQLLDKCACSIDAIADRMSYDDYEKADTILSMQQASVGPRGGLFRDTPVAKATLEKLHRAQAEANLKCGS
jgi:hypothetical protein